MTHLEQAKQIATQADALINDFEMIRVRIQNLDVQITKIESETSETSETLPSRVELTDDLALDLADIYIQRNDYPLYSYYLEVEDFDREDEATAIIEVLSEPHGLYMQLSVTLSDDAKSVEVSMIESFDTEATDVMFPASTIELYSLIDTDEAMSAVKQAIVLNGYHLSDFEVELGRYQHSTRVISFEVFDSDGYVFFYMETELVNNNTQIKVECVQSYYPQIEDTFNALVTNR